jgi:hypothetical protein
VEAENVAQLQRRCCHRTESSLFASGSRSRIRLPRECD